MGVLGSLLVKVKADTTQFSTGMTGAMGGINKVGLAATAAGAAIVAAFAVASVKAATELEAEMANVATLLDGDVTPRINEMKSAVQDLSMATGKSTSDLTDGLYQVVSAFGDSAESMDILRIASEAATAGLSTTTDAINLISAVTKGYGDTSAMAAQHVTDLAFMAVKLGQTTFPELASAIGKVVPLSQSLSISQEELFGVMATLTGVTGNTAEVATQYRGILVALMKPTENLKAIYDELGVSTGQQLIQQEGFQGALETVKKSAEENGLQLTDLMGRVEGVTAMMALTGAQADVFTEKLGKMTQASGSASKAFNVQKDTVQFAQQRIAAYTQVIKQKFGDVLLPFWADFLDVVIKAFTGISKQFTQAHQNIVDFTNGVKNIFRGFQRELFISISNVSAKLAELSKDAFPEFSANMREMSVATGEASRQIQLQMDSDDAIASTIGLYSDELEKNRLENNKNIIELKHKQSIEEIMNQTIDAGTDAINTQTTAITAQTEAIEEQIEAKNKSIAQIAIENKARFIEGSGTLFQSDGEFRFADYEGNVRTANMPTKEEIRARAIAEGTSMDVASMKLKGEAVTNITVNVADGQGAVDTIKKLALTGAY